MDIKEIRRTLLQVLNDYSKTEIPNFRQDNILKEAVRRLGIESNYNYQQALFSVWGDLFRSGIIWWGHDLRFPNLPIIHLTEKGKKALENFSRDPSNPEGYLNYISSLKINEVANSYIEEAVETYNNNCFKASAVMIGAASESMILELRDNLVHKIKTKGEIPSSKFNDKRISTVINRIYSLLKSEEDHMDSDLFEAFSIYWNSFIGQIRISRNDAGHPKSIYPVDEETVHSSLLIFPNLVKLINELNIWIKDKY